VSNRFVEQGLRSPVNLTWEVSLACNLRCSHCLSASGLPAENEMTTAEALDLVEQVHTCGPTLIRSWMPVTPAGS
jgi:MoaA/NifB/PqqE/SkfB family radical SAM enzyme